jgi:hypothetical protein
MMKTNQKIMKHNFVVTEMALDELVRLVSKTHQDKSNIPTHIYIFPYLLIFIYTGNWLFIQSSIIGINIRIEDNQILLFI